MPAAQQETADRLYRGMSSSTQSSSVHRSLAQRGGGNKYVVSARHRLYSNSYTSSGGAAGYVYANVDTQNYTDATFGGIAQRIEGNDVMILSNSNHNGTNMNIRPQINVFSSDDDSSLTNNRKQYVPASLRQQIYTFENEDLFNDSSKSKKSDQYMVSQQGKNSSRMR